MGSKQEPYFCGTDKASGRQAPEHTSWIWKKIPRQLSRENPHSANYWTQWCRFVSMHNWKRIPLRSMDYQHVPSNSQTNVSPLARRRFSTVTKWMEEERLKQNFCEAWVGDTTFKQYHRVSSYALFIFVTKLSNHSQSKIFVRCTKVFRKTRNDVRIWPHTDAVNCSIL